MRQIISLFIGSGAIKLAQKMYQLYSLQYSIQYSSGFIDKIFLQDSRAMFRVQQVNQSFKCIPRIILIDSEINYIDQILTSKLKNFLDPHNLISAKQMPCKTFSKDLFKNQQFFQNLIYKQIFNQAEKCSNLQGFQIFQNIGGGCSSGYGSKIMKFLKSQFGDKQLINYVVHSQIQKSNQFQFQAYNSVLGYQIINQQSKACLTFDNFQLKKIIKNKYIQSKHTFNDVNELLSYHLSNISVKMRFDSVNYAGGLKNLNFFEEQLITKNTQLKYFISVHSPIFTDKNGFNFQIFDTQHNFSYLSQLPIYNPKTCYCYLDMFRGQFRSCLVGQAMTNAIRILNIKSSNILPFLRKFEFHYQKLIGFDKKQVKLSRSILLNSELVLHSFNHFNQKFDWQLKKKKGLEQYLSQGMEIQDFLNARELMAKIQDDYQQISHFQFVQEEAVNHGLQYQQGG